MKYIEFGANKQKVSKIALGCMRIPELNVLEIVNLLETSLDAGINFLDIADCYSKGKAESLLGEAFSKQTSLRDNFFLQSKCGIRKVPVLTVSPLKYWLLLPSLRCFCYLLEVNMPWITLLMENL